MVVSPFFFNDTATTEIYTLSLHDALPISYAPVERSPAAMSSVPKPAHWPLGHVPIPAWVQTLLVPQLQAHLQRPHRYPLARSEEHTSELQSRQYPVCRLLLEKKKTWTRKE